MDFEAKLKTIKTNKFQINVLSHSRGIPLPRYTRHIIEFENHATTPLIIHLKCAYMKTWQLREVKKYPLSKEAKFNYCMSSISVHGYFKKSHSYELGIKNNNNDLDSVGKFGSWTKRMVNTKFNTMQVETLPIFHTQNCGHDQVSRGHL